MLTYTEENSTSLIIIVSLLSMFAGVSTVFMKLDEDKEEHSKSYTYSMLFQGLFIGAVSPILMFQFLVIIEPILAQIIFKTWQTKITVEKDFLRIFYWGVSLAFSREIVIRVYNTIKRKKQK